MEHTSVMVEVRTADGLGCALFVGLNHELPAVGDQVSAGEILGRVVMRTWVRAKDSIRVDRVILHVARTSPENEFAKQLFDMERPPNWARTI